MTPEGWVQLATTVSGLTTPGLLVLILVTGYYQRWMWVTTHKTILEISENRRQDLLQLLELERREKENWKSLAIRTHGLTEDVMGLAKKQQERVGS